MGLRGLEVGRPESVQGNWVSLSPIGPKPETPNPKPHPKCPESELDRRLPSSARAPLVELARVSGLGAS